MDKEIGYYEKVKEATDFLTLQLSSMPNIALVLGSGMNGLLELLDVKQKIAFEKIPHFPHASAESHEGVFYLGIVEGVNVLVMAGRLHFYEGYAMEKVTFGVRILGMLGIQHILMTNAAGSVNPNLKTGKVVLVKDHINFMPENPLRGKNDKRWGVRFPDMSEVYDKKIRKSAIAFANKNNIPLNEGVYLGLQGPNLETPAEYNAFRMLGADVVGMSTVPEVIIAKHMSIKVNVLSVVSNECFAFDKSVPVSIEEVLGNIQKSYDYLRPLVIDMLRQIDRSINES